MATVDFEKKKNTKKKEKHLKKKRKDEKKNGPDSSHAAHRLRSFALMDRSTEKKESRTTAGDSLLFRLFFPFFYESGPVRSGRKSSTVSLLLAALFFYPIFLFWVSSCRRSAIDLT